MVHEIDLHAIFIFLGIVQAVFLCLFFFSKENRKVQANFFQGLMIAALYRFYRKCTVAGRLFRVVSFFDWPLVLLDGCLPD
jgi:hypothetical protein